MFFRRLIFQVICVFNENVYTHTHTRHAAKGQWAECVRRNSSESEPQSDNGVECVLVLPETETYTGGTTAVHSQRSCTVTPNQSQAQAEPLRRWKRGRRERGRAEAAPLVRDPGRSSHSRECLTFASADCQKDFIERWRQEFWGFFFVINVTKDKCRRRCRKGEEQAQDKEDEQLWPWFQTTSSFVCF